MRTVSQRVGGSLDLPPVDGEAIHTRKGSFTQAVDAVDGVMLGLLGQMRVADGGENGLMAEDLLHLDQIDAGFDQVRGVGVTQAVWGDLFS